MLGLTYLDKPLPLLTILSSVEFKYIVPELLFLHFCHLNRLIKAGKGHIFDVNKFIEYQNGRTIPIGFASFSTAGENQGWWTINEFLGT